jgi:hypothetical protein
MNPRVLLWLKAVGLTAAAIARPSGADVPRVTVDGYTNLWTILYSEWIMGKWEAWALSLGFTQKTEKSVRPHVKAQLAGHTSDEFDKWLKTSA